MKNLISAVVIPIIMVTSTAIAQQFPPQKVLNNLTGMQISKINILSEISKSKITTLPAYDHHLKTI